MKRKVPIPMMPAISTLQELFLEEYDARVYWMDVRELEDKDLFSRCYKRLSDERRKKIDSYLFGRDRRLSLGAGILLDKGLSAYGLREGEVSISYGKNGKPHLSRHSHIHFNLSHSGEMALAVFAGRDVGCDIEKVQNADMELAEEFFTKGEYDYIVGQKTKNKRDEAFYRIWTLKESFVKAVGSGLMLPLNSFEIKIMADGKIDLIQNVDRRKYYFKEYPFEEYCGAVCFQSSHSSDICLL